MLALAIQIAESVDLQPVSQNAKQEIPGQVRGRLPPRNALPTVAKLSDVEIA
jgi:hypothetical protein